MNISHLIRRYLPSLLQLKIILIRTVKNTLSGLRTTWKYLGERWRSTEPGLRWAYVFSIIAGILFVPYSPGAYVWIELLLIPVTFCAFIQGGLRFRLLWLGFLLFNILQIVNLTYYHFIFGIRLNDYIAFPIVIIAIRRGFLSFDLRKTADKLIYRGPLRALLALLLFIIITYVGDLLLPFYGYFETYKYFTHIITITGASSALAAGIFIVIYILLTISILAKDSVAIIFSFILLVSDALNWIAFVFLRIDNGISYFFDEFVNFGTYLKYIYTVRFAVAFILPILVSVIVALFLVKLPDTVFVRGKRTTERK